MLQINPVCKICRQVEPLKTGNTTSYSYSCELQILITFAPFKTPLEIVFFVLTFFLHYKCMKSILISMHFLFLGYESMKVGEKETSGKRCQRDQECYIQCFYPSINKLFKTSFFSTPNGEKCLGSVPCSSVSQWQL